MARPDVARKAKQPVGKTGARKKAAPVDRRAGTTQPTYLKVGPGPKKTPPPKKAPVPKKAPIAKKAPAVKNAPAVKKATGGGVELQRIREGAAIRRAQARLLHLDEMHDALRLADAGVSQRDIAEALQTTQPRVHRMLKAMSARGGDRVTPEEIILRANLEGTDRNQLVNRLRAMTYSFREHAPGQVDGVVSGTWDQVRMAARSGLLTKREYERVRETVRPPKA